MDLQDIKFLIRMPNGSFMACEPKTEAMIDPAALVSSVKVHTKKTFEYDGRRFTYSLHAERGKFITVIQCPYLKWSVPIKYSPADKKFRLDGGRDRTELYFKDVIVLNMKTQDNAPATFVHYTKNDSPRMTNISDNGHCCLPMPSLPDIPSPDLIISLIENTPSNMDISTGDAFDIKKEGKYMVMVAPRGRQSDNPNKHYLHEYI